eukprot:3893909-Pyramimonas_sp.AAC.1
MKRGNHDRDSNLSIQALGSMLTLARLVLLRLERSQIIHYMLNIGPRPIAASSITSPLTPPGILQTMELPHFATQAAYEYMFPNVVLAPLGSSLASPSRWMWLGCAQATAGCRP